LEAFLIHHFPPSYFAITMLSLTMGIFNSFSIDSIFPRCSTFNLWLENQTRGKGIPSIASRRNNSFKTITPMPNQKNTNVEEQQHLRNVVTMLKDTKNKSTSNYKNMTKKCGPKD
jgi:hypothetical protein